jgi:hypothetical protein
MAPYQRIHAHSQTDTIIIIDIRKKDYRDFDKYPDWNRFLTVKNCPACLDSTNFSRHGFYWKYYFNERIPILRIRCKQCRTTHALIPAFSLPGTSLGTEQTEEYLIKRYQGQGRGAAGSCFARKGVPFDHLRRMDRMFLFCVDRAKAVLGSAENRELGGMEWIQSVINNPERPLYEINRYCLIQGVNCIFFTRPQIMLFQCRKRGKEISHNNISPGKDVAAIDSS